MRIETLLVYSSFVIGILNNLLFYTIAPCISLFDLVLSIGRISIKMFLIQVS